MQLTIYIPKKDDDVVKSARKAAASQEPSIGLGAYLVLLHKQEQARKDDGR